MEGTTSLRNTVTRLTNLRLHNFFIRLWIWSATTVEATCSRWRTRIKSEAFFSAVSLSLLQSHTCFIYERVAVGRKYPCRSLPQICLPWELLQSLFHVQLGWNFNTKQSLYVQPFWLWPDDNVLAWSGAVHLQKKAIILSHNTDFYMVKVVLAGS